MGDRSKELQLLHALESLAPSSSSLEYQSMAGAHHRRVEVSPPSLDLQLSISLERESPLCGMVVSGPICDHRCRNTDAEQEEEEEDGCVEVVKWQAAEQVRLAAVEKAYAERVREMTRREMELAELEFARARNLWERAQEEVERAERLKERVTLQAVDTTACMEITCQSCRQRFRP